MNLALKVSLRAIVQTTSPSFTCSALAVRAVLPPPTATTIKQEGVKIHIKLTRILG